MYGSAWMLDSVARFGQFYETDNSRMEIPI